MSVIKKETESSVSPTYEGYCHEITVTLHLDGSVTPKTIPFGNCGDKNITRFSFNVQELIAAVPTLKEDYTFYINIYDPSLPKSSTNPAQYTITDKFILPSSYTEKAGSYRCIFCLTEKSGNEHNTTDTTEQWVSKICTAVVNPTIWDESLVDNLAAATILADNPNFLTKPAVILTPKSDHYTIVTSAVNLGQKMDRYIRRIEMVGGATGLDDGLDARYGVFICETAIFVTKFKAGTEGYSCWVPPEVCSVPDTWTFIVVAQTNDGDTAADCSKRWVSNTLLFTVTDNFLSSVTAADANFVLANRKLLYTRDAKLFRAPTSSGGDIYQSAYTGEQIDAAIADLTNKEDKANKTSVIPDANEQAYPSAAAVIDYFQNKQGDEIIINGSLPKEP